MQLDAICITIRVMRDAIAGYEGVELVFFVNKILLLRGLTNLLSLFFVLVYKESSETLGFHFLIGCTEGDYGLLFRKRV